MTLPESVTDIGKYAFEACYGLRSVYIPKSVESIGYYAFAFCRSLKNVFVFWDTEEEIKSVKISNPFNPSYSYASQRNLIDATLYVPTGTKSLYETSKVWGDFVDIQEFDADSRSVRR